MTVKFIQRGGKEFALVSKKTFECLSEAAEDLADIRAYDRAKAKPQEFVPIEVADRLIAGEWPLRVWREYRAVKSADLAKRVGVSAPYMSQLEAGKRVPSIDVLKKLATALNVDIDDLVI
jgi:DNA-binding XRE family transcriptional regulator